MQPIRATIEFAKITSEGVVTTLAGSTQGSSDGTGGTAQFNRPVGVVVDATGNVYVGDLLITVSEKLPRLA